QNHAEDADERVSPELGRLLEVLADGVVVDLDDVDVLIAADGRRRGRGIAGVLPGEKAIVSGEWLTIVPLHALLELPRDRQTVLGDATVFEARGFGGEHWREVAIGVPVRQGLVEQARAVLVLG